ncbi:MAG: hypothetical protein ATN35_01255 [Epulopiscium sp. Nele67-Bin004]|nr:MAG: hypothetical protein ATN35_01255 [Epulopiscium sp. Nele67-Bin004]
MAKKKGKSNNVEFSPMRYETRLRHGAIWVEKYSNKNIIRDYRKKFKLSVLDTLSDLYKLNVLDKEKYNQLVEAEYKSQNPTKKQRGKKAKENSREHEYDMVDPLESEFFWVGGYTSGGAPYGVKWDELDSDLYENLLE